MCRAGSVESGGSIVHNILHAGIFLLDTDMKSALLFCSLVAIQSTWVPTRSVLLWVTSLSVSIHYLICVYSDIRYWLWKQCQRMLTPWPNWVGWMQRPIRGGGGRDGSGSESDRDGGNVKDSGDGRSDIDSGGNDNGKDGSGSCYWYKGRWQPVIIQTLNKPRNTPRTSIMWR
jgi:hypothetical protein